MADHTPLKRCPQCGFYGCYDGVNCTPADTVEAANDPIAHPDHYTQGSIECIDFINDKNLNFNLGNAIKYIVRCNFKGKKREDLLKAKQYIDFELEKNT